MTEKVQEIERLMNKAKDANRDAVKHLFDIMYYPLLHVAVKMLSDVQLAKDIVQESFSALLERGLNCFHNYDDIENYLIKCTKDGCVSHFRSNHQKCKQLTDFAYLTGAESSATVDERIDPETIQIIMSAFEKLPPIRKEILRQILKGATAEEVAAKLNISTKSIHSTNYFTLNLLRKVLKELI